MIDLALIAARLLLATVFTVAALAKLADRAGSRQTLADFGVPVALTGALGIVLPVAELAVAFTLIPLATAWWGALGALALVLIFIAGIAGNLARGRAPTCRCFGQLAAAPIGPATIVRNLALAGLAGFVAWQGRLDPGPSILGWLGALTTGEQVSLAVSLVALGLLVATVTLLLQIVGQQGRLLLRLDALERGLTETGALARPDQDARSPAGLAVGTRAPTFTLPDLSGKTVGLDDLLDAGRPVLLVFADPHCGPCTALLPDVGRWQREHADALTIAVVSRGSADESRARATEHGVTTILLQRGYEVADAYQVYETPAAMLVRPDGTIGSQAARGGEQIRGQVAQVLDGNASVPWADLVPLAMVDDHQHQHQHQHQERWHDAQTSLASIGEPARPLVLPDLEGDIVDLAGFRGANVLLLFWNPDCGFCQQLLPAVRAFEADPPTAAPRLLVVSTGTPAENRALGLRAPLVLDHGFTIGAAYGADGTPSAILIDADGRVASELLVGAAAILSAFQWGRGVSGFNEQTDVIASA